MEVASNSVLNLQSAFTIEAWVKFNGNSTDMYAMLECGDRWNQALFYYTLRIAGGKIRFDLGQGNGGYTGLYGNSTVTTGQWHHIAAIYENNQMRVYLDGVLDGSQSYTWSPPSAATSFRVGRETMPYMPNYFNGLIDEVRVSAGALYNATFSPAAHLSAQSSTKGLWKFDGSTANDASGNNLHGTLSGGATYSTDVPTSATYNSISLDGTNSYVLVPSNSILNLQSAFTVEAWIKFQGNSTDMYSIEECGDKWGTAYFYHILRIAGGKVRFDLGQSDGGYVGLYGNTSITTGVWHHVAAVYDGSQMKIYLDGTLDGSQSYTWNPPNIAAPLRIGRETNIYSPRYFNGLVDEVRISQGAIYTLNFTPQTHLSPQSGTKGLWRFDNSTSNDSSSNNLNGTLQGAATYSDDVPGGSSPSAPVAPSNLSAAAVSNSQINLSWTDNSTNETGFKIERKTGIGGTYAEIATVAANMTSYANTGLSVGTQYFYRLRATNATGDSPYSNEATATTGNNPPTVSLTSPANNAVFNAPANISLTANASDTDGTISKVDFYQGTTLIETDLTSPYSVTWHNVAAGSYQLTAKATDNNGAVTTSTVAAITVNSSHNGFTTERLEPDNRTGQAGEDILSRNFNWSLPLVGLPGRAGLDLGLSLTYNSLVWTKDSSGSYIKYDADRGFPGPGFRLGFPVIEQKYYNSQTGKNSYLMITPSGSRVELRQVGTSNLYESGDSSYIQLTEGSGLVVRTMDGTQLSYSWYGSQYQCTQVKDRNGNFISITYNAQAQISNVVDTLGRIINFNYNTDNNLISITQDWGIGGNQQTYTWASFSYSTLTIQTNFTGLTVIGPQNGSQVTVLSKVLLADNSYIKFSYSSWGQVYQFTRYAADSNPQTDSHPLSYVRYNVDSPGAQTDCPRFTARRDWAARWNGDNDGVPSQLEEAATTFAGPVAATWNTPPEEDNPDIGIMCQMTTPDGTTTKVYYHVGGWDKGLPVMTETLAGPANNQTVQRWATTFWTQDLLSYPSNPRPIETNVGDPAGNRRRTRFEYYPATSYSLPKAVVEYAADAATVLRRTQTEYNLSNIYTNPNRHIIGVVSAREVRDGNNALVSRVEYSYDDDGDYLQPLTGAVQHDDVNYGPTFTARALLISVTRINVENPADVVTTEFGYNTTGSLIFTRSPRWQAGQPALNFQTTISYTDSFADGVNHNTYAYPTTVTNGAGYSTTSKYNYDIGAVTRTLDPLGAEVVMEYDSIGRLSRRTHRDSAAPITQYAAYTSYEYPINQMEIRSYSLLDTSTLVYSLQSLDGAGRVIGVAASHPSNGGASGQRMVYDVMGRLSQQSNPVEITNPLGVGQNPSVAPANWTVTGDDIPLGWKWTTQTYDWKGRVTITTRPAVAPNTNDTQTEAIYEGCGCAGGEMVTLKGEQLAEGRRTQKIYYDILGREKKREILDWAGNIYTTTVNTYNTRDQMTLSRQYAGAEGSVTYRDAIFNYDGHGRLRQRHAPEASEGAFTNYTYYPDDSIYTITDARGAITNYEYNNRGLLKKVSYSLQANPPGNEDIPIPAEANFEYDAASNRTLMTDGSGSVVYEYDKLSRLKSETRQFNETVPQAPASNQFKLQYTYSLSGQLKSYTDIYGEQVKYEQDGAGRIGSVSGTLPNGEQVQYVTSALYRAWGSLKSIAYGTGMEMRMDYNSRMQASEYKLLGRQHWVQGQTDDLTIQYQYYEDGRLRFSEESHPLRPNDYPSAKFARSYEYDFMGRLRVAKTGAEARGQTETNFNNRPYRQTYTYDAFGKMTSADRWHWTENYVTQFNEDRDADGRERGPQGRFKYDAGGGLVFSSGYGNSASGNTMWLDGTGQAVKSLATDKDCHADGGCELTTYYIRSSVLGGQVINEISQKYYPPFLNVSARTIEKRETFVFAAGARIAKHVVVSSNSSTVTSHDSTYIENRDASGVVFDETRVRGIGPGNYMLESDPFGAVVGMENPYTPQSNGYGGPPCPGPEPDDCGDPEEEEDPDYSDLNYEDEGYGNPTSFTCMVDGFAVPCQSAFALMRNSGGGGDVPTTRQPQLAAPSTGGPQSIWQPAYSDGSRLVSTTYGERGGEVTVEGLPQEYEIGGYSIWDTQVEIIKAIDGGAKNAGTKYLNREHQQTAADAIRKAQQLINANPACAEYLKGRFRLDAVKNLEKIIFFNGFREGGSDFVSSTYVGTDPIGWTWASPGYGNSVIYLYSSFFTNRVGGVVKDFFKTYDVKDAALYARALVILHELKHAGGRVHLTQSESDSWDKNIYEKCFASLMPKNVAE